MLKFNEMESFYKIWHYYVSMRKNNVLNVLDFALCVVPSCIPCPYQNIPW